jgi:hypothetical protein
MTETYNVKRRPRRIAGQGVFAVDRGIFDHPIFAREPYTEREMWLWMLSSAAWADKRIRVGRSFIELKRGQLGFSLRFLALKSQWTVSRIRRFLKRLESDAMVTVSATREATLIAICNYDRYQFGRRTDAAHADAKPDSSPARPRQEQLDNSEANASGADAPRDYRAELFGRGLQTLARLTGKGPDACRSFVGKCLKAASDDAVTVLGLIEDADRNRVVDPSAWISVRLKATGPPAKPLTEFQRKQAETNDVRAHLKNLANGGGSRGTVDRPLQSDHGERSETVRGWPRHTLLAIPRAPGSGGD